MSSSVTTSVRKLLLRLVAVLVVAVGIPVAIAGPASAHHPEITASVDCSGLVSYTATSWATNSAPQKTNPDIGVYLKQGMVKVGQGSFSASNGYAFSGTTNIGAATSATLVVRADAKWGSGAGAGDTREVTVNAPTNCDATTITNTCDTASVDLVNNGAAAQTYTITMTGQKTQTKTVAGGSKDAVTFPGLQEDATYTVSVSIGKTVVKTSTFTVDCSKPTATMTTSCTEYVVNLDNSTSSAATAFTITVNGKATDYSVGAKQTRAVALKVVEDTTYTVKVTFAGGTLLENTSTVDCSQPATVITATCTGYDVLLDNSASKVDTTYAVTVNKVKKNYTVKAGQTQVVSETKAAEGDTVSISVKVGAKELRSETFTIDCEKPAATIKHDCTTYTVVLDNTASKVDVSFVVDVNGTKKTVVVTAGKADTVTGPVVEDTRTTVTVTVKGVKVATDTFTMNCEKPAATVAETCTTYTIELDNSKSNVDATFTVTFNGVTTTHVVGKTVKKIVEPVTENSTNTVLIKADGVTVLDKTLKVDCEKPAAVITHDCTSYTVDLDNSKSTVAVTFVVNVNGTDESVVVPAGKQGTATGPVVEDQVTTVTVTVGTTKIAADTFTVNCEKPVATFTKDCTSFTVTLDNSKSNVDAIYTVTIDGVAKNYTVGSTPQVITTTVAEDSTHTVSVVWGSKTLVDETVTTDCEDAAAIITSDCTSYTAVLDNTGSTVDLDFVVTVNGVDTTIPVKAGDKVTETGPVVEDQATTVTVAVKGDTLATDTFTKNCQQPVATIVDTCTGYTITLDNSASTVAVDFVVTVNDLTTVVNVPAGKTETVEKTDAVEGATYDISVANGSTVLATKVFTVDCQKPVAIVTHDCTSYTVSLDNTASTVPVIFTVTIDGTVTLETVPAGQTQTLTGPVAEDSSHIIEVANGAEVLAQVAFTVDCQTSAPTAALTHDCTTYTATLDNTGSNIPVAFTVTVNGAGQVVTVPAGQTQLVSGPVVEDTTYEVTVSAGTAQLTTGSFTVDCVNGDGGGGEGDGGNGTNGDADNAGNGGGNEGNNGGGSGGGGASGSDTPSSDTGVLPATGSPALLGLAMLLGLGLVVGGGLLVAGDRRRPSST